jgi:PcfJ-like protein
MTIIDWTTEIAKRCSHLAGFGKLPPPAEQHSALQALAVLSIITDVPIEHALASASTMPRLAIPNALGRHDLVDELLGLLTQTVAAPSRGHFYHTFSAANWLDAHGLDELVVRSVQHTTDDTGRSDLLAHAARKAQHLMEQQDRLRDQHMRLLLARDMPDLEVAWQRCVPEKLAWILAHEHDGDPTRAIRVQRRLQAFRLYASLADRLRDRSVTEVIDSGRELVPALTQRLALTKAQIRALREASTPSDTLTRQHQRDFQHAVRHLQAHGVPLHQWPGGGRPAQHAAWQSSPWLTIDEFTLIRADYYGTDATTVRDAVRSFNDDLLSPLLAGIAAPLADCRTFVSSLALTPENLPAIQQFLAAIRRALIGDRGPKAFGEAAQLWHRRAAAVAALRNENQTDRPGWPPLCPPWTSRGGTFEIVPLTTAKALVEEGNAHHHCVGTYYES